MTKPSPILPRRSGSIPKAVSPLGAGAILIETKATTTEPSLITTRRFDSIPTMLSLFADEEERN